MVALVDLSNTVFVVFNVLALFLVEHGTFLNILALVQGFVESAIDLAEMGHLLLEDGLAAVAEVLVLKGVLGVFLRSVSLGDSLLEGVDGVVDSLFEDLCLVGEHTRFRQVFLFSFFLTDSLFVGVRN